MLDDCGLLSHRSHGALQFRGPALPVPVVCVVRSLLKTSVFMHLCYHLVVFLIQQRIPIMSLSYRYENALGGACPSEGSPLPPPWPPSVRPTSDARCEILARATRASASR